MSERASEKSEMSEIAFASNAMRERIAPIGSAQYVQGRIRLAARALRWSFSRSRDVWYADERVSLKPREVRDIEQASGIKYGRQEVGDVDALISRADALLMGTDPDFVRPFVAALRALVGAADRTGTKE